MKLKTNSYYYSFARALEIAKNVPLDLIHAHLKARTGRGIKHVKRGDKCSLAFSLSLPCAYTLSLSLKPLDGGRIM